MNTRNIAIITAAIVGITALWGADSATKAASRSSEIRHELGRFVALHEDSNMLDADIITPPDYDRLATTEPGFFVRVECKGENWNLPENKAFDLTVQWAVYGDDGSLQGPSDTRTVYGNCYQQDRDTTVDLTGVMPRSGLSHARTSVWLWPPSADGAGQPRIIIWRAVGMNYEHDLPEPVVGPPGPKGDKGDTGAAGAPGIDGQRGPAGKDGAPGVCDCQPEQECNPKTCRNPKHKHYKKKD